MVLRFGALPTGLFAVAWLTLYLVFHVRLTETNPDPGEPLNWPPSILATLVALGSFYLWRWGREMGGSVGRARRRLCGAEASFGG